MAATVRDSAMRVRKECQNMVAGVTAAVHAVSSMEHTTALCHCGAACLVSVKVKQTLIPPVLTSLSSTSAVSGLFSIPV